ncbi:hypothetical protein PAHAL_7G151900 [Panicum hallii]|uniref:Uncharacterized protein n=1 Tax=Panicum hallii TaxID=206008 RepID=A0A2T8ICC5_9POAL|nr:hypothetical protein PAHAL_7G151900 [Panicum hallii]
MVRDSLTLGACTLRSFRDEHGAQLCYHIVDYCCREVQMFYACQVLLFLQPRALDTFRSQTRTGGMNQPFLFLTFPFALPTLCALVVMSYHTICTSYWTTVTRDSRQENTYSRSPSEVAKGPLFLERRTVTGGPHRWLIACLIDSSVTVSQMPFLLLLPVMYAPHTLWPKRVVHSPSLRRIFLPAPFPLPFQPPLSTIFTGSMSRHKVRSTERRLHGP